MKPNDVFNIRAQKNKKVKRIENPKSNNSISERKKERKKDRKKII